MIECRQTRTLERRRNQLAGHWARTRDNLTERRQTCTLELLASTAKHAMTAGNIRTHGFRKIYFILLHGPLLVLLATLIMLHRLLHRLLLVLLLALVLLRRLLLALLIALVLLYGLLLALLLSCLLADLFHLCQ